MHENRVDLFGISVSFGNVCALDNVSLGFRNGEIQALVGENGAGKSTIMAVLFGLITDYQGEIVVNGKASAWRSPKDAIKSKIGMVHQHFMLQDSMTVLENIILCNEPLNYFGFVDFKTARHQVRSLLKEYKLSLDLDQLIEDLAVGQRQLVEILKLLYRNSTVLILDEPTAVLTPVERDQLFSALKRFKEDGKTVILITHKIDEVFSIADRVSVMRSGKLISSSTLAETNRDTVRSQIIGKARHKSSKRTKSQPTTPVLLLDEVIVPGLSRDERPLSVNVKKGEIVGIAGVSGNGQAALVEAVVGLRQTTSGAIFIQGKDVTRRSVEERRRIGMSYIPEDRQKTGLAISGDIIENSAISNIQDPYFSSGFFLQRQNMMSHAEKLITSFDIKVASPKHLAKTMSGGNKQKLVVARELSLKTPLIIVENPTWGVDIGASSFIHRQILSMRDAGHAILLVSSELDEILELSDRIFVMFEGQLSKEFPISGATRAELGKLMLAKDSTSFGPVGEVL